MENPSRVALVTGGSRGIGRGIVLELARLGFRIAINYRGNREAAEQTLTDSIQVGAGDSMIVQADVSDLDDHAPLLDQVLNRWGRIDLLVNNAGVAPEVRLDLLETTPASWDRAISNNLRGPFFLTQRTANLMVRLRALGTIHDPQIHFVTSVSSVMASVSRGEYCVAKAGLSMVVKLFAVKLADLGIRVFEIRPGIIATDMTAGVKAVYDERIANGLSPIRRWGTPEDVGKAVAALAQNALPFSTGAVLDVDGGLMIPRL